MSNPTATSSEPRMVPLARINLAEGHTHAAASTPTSCVADHVEARVRRDRADPVASDPDHRGRLRSDRRRAALPRRERGGSDEIPAVVRVGTNGDAIDIAITENLQRQELNPVDEAHGFARARHVTG